MHDAVIETKRGYKRIVTELIKITRLRASSSPTIFG